MVCGGPLYNDLGAKWDCVAGGGSGDWGVWSMEVQRDGDGNPILDGNGDQVPVSCGGAGAACSLPNECLSGVCSGSVCQ